MAALQAADVPVVGATDYFTIDGYRVLKSYQDKGRLRGITLLPNIEFRLDTFVASRKDGEGQRRLNFHVIFSQDVPAQDIEEHFLHDIYFNHRGAPGDDNDRRKLKRANLEELGRNLIAEHETFRTQSPLEVGAMNAVVNLDHLVSVLRTGTRFRDKFLLVLADEYANLIPWGGQDHNTRRILLQRSDMVLTSNPRTIHWCLGRPPYENGSNGFQREFGTLKPCLHGSDAHRLPDIAHPCSKRGQQGHRCVRGSPECDLRYCWIKADPTFEGLRQLLFEPEERVRIQTGDPTPSKSIYSFSGLSVPRTPINPELTLGAVEVPLNPGLVAVTGGKGSGKTALVDLLAHCFVDRKDIPDRNSFVRRIAPDAPQLAIEVRFLNDEVFHKTLADGISFEDSGITYIAQGELERYIDEQSDLNRYIHRVIFDSPAVRDSSDVFEYESLVHKTTSLQAELDAKNDLIDQLERATTREVEEELTRHGKKAAAAIQDAEARIAVAEKKLSSETRQQNAEQQEAVARLKRERTDLVAFSELLQENRIGIDEFITRLSGTFGRLNTFIEQLGLGAPLALPGYEGRPRLDELLATTETRLARVVTEIEGREKTIRNLTEDMRAHARLLAKRRTAVAERERLLQDWKSLQTQKSQLVENRQVRRRLYQGLLESVVAQQAQYTKIIGSFGSDKADVLSDLDFEAELGFDEQRLLLAIEDLVDNRRVQIFPTPQTPSACANAILALKRVATNRGDSNGSIESNVEAAVDQVDRLIEQLKPQLKTARSGTALELYRVLFRSYLTVRPTARYKRTSLDRLSLGQKATVLIKIYLAEGEQPIVIDSHDDHLDNEFIMEELVGSIREARNFRQVIVASNNGNVVVNSDADQVVVAQRQNGEISYVSGGMEDPEIRSHALRVLEGGYEAFRRRQQKYRIAPGSGQRPS